MKMKSIIRTTNVQSSYHVTLTKCFILNYIILFCIVAIKAFPNCIQMHCDSKLVCLYVVTKWCQTTWKVKTLTI